MRKRRLTGAAQVVAWEVPVAEALEAQVGAAVPVTAAGMTTAGVRGVAVDLAGVAAGREFAPFA